MLRWVKIVLVVLVALWGLLGGTGNLAGYQAGHAQVVAVMGREGTTFPGAGPFIAMSHPILTHTGYAVIWLGKLLSGFTCLWGAVRLWRARGAHSGEFNDAKQWALTGSGIALIMLFGGFVVAGGVYFSMWSSEAGLLSHSFATQYIVGIGMIALFVASPDR